MARVQRDEWVPSNKNAGLAYAAILNGMGMAFKVSPFKVNCKITCTKYERQINLQWQTRCVVFAITRQGEIWMNLYGEYIDAIVKLVLTEKEEIIHGRGGWEKALSTLVAKWLRMASRKDDSYEKAVNELNRQIEAEIEEKIEFDLDDYCDDVHACHYDEDFDWDTYLD